MKFVEDSLQKTWSDMVCLSRPYHFKFLKGCLPQISLGPFLNTLCNMILRKIAYSYWKAFKKDFLALTNFSRKMRKV